MGRRIRFIPEGGALVEVTCRTIQGRFLLRPSEELNRIVTGVLARAARRHSVPVVGVVYLSNHFHLLLWVQHAQQLARFMGYLNGNLAREAGRLHGWRDKFWSRRYQAILVSDEEEAQRTRLKYLLAHGAKENLVQRNSSPHPVWPTAV
jgi:REP element-mobilizing transposase RayT